MLATPLRLNLVLFVSGLLAFLAVAPFGLYPLTMVSLAMLFLGWLRSATPRAAAWSGFWFGLGMYGAGISFVYVALHDYGDMPFLLAVPVTILAAAFFSLYSALAGYLQARLAYSVPVRLMLVMPATWTLLEWVRGFAFTGFPCMLAGYSQTASPLAGYAPVMGVYGVSLMAAASAGLLAYLYYESLATPRRTRRMVSAFLVLLAAWGGGAVLRMVDWTQPAGEPVKVSLLQGNIPQELKFDEERLPTTLDTYRRMVLSSDAKLIVLPESAFPILRSQVPAKLERDLREYARSNDGDILIGAFEREQHSYYNSVFSLGSSPSQHYRKNHLVPFGEFIPLRPVLGWLINVVLHIPMGDLARGGPRQPVMEVAGQKVAVDICYEDVFGEEIIRYLPEATLLVNVTNDAWYGRSYAALQHNQVAQMRALETGRMMLRATNTGVTSVIDRNGHILHMLPQHVEATLTASVQGYSGATPYVIVGNALAVSLCLLLLAVAWWLRRRCG